MESTLCRKNLPDRQIGRRVRAIIIAFQMIDHRKPPWDRRGGNGDGNPLIVWLSADGYAAEATFFACGGIRISERISSGGGRLMLKEAIMLAVWLIGLFLIIGIAVAGIWRMVSRDSFKYDERFVWRKRL